MILGNKREAAQSWIVRILVKTRLKARHLLFLAFGIVLLLLLAAVRLVASSGPRVVGSAVTGGPRQAGQRPPLSPSSVAGSGANMSMTLTPEEEAYEAYLRLPVGVHPEEDAAYLKIFGARVAKEMLEQKAREAEQAKEEKARREKEQKAKEEEECMRKAREELKREQEGKNEKDKLKPAQEKPQKQPSPSPAEAVKE